jgi:dihydrofolate reductase
LANLPDERGGVGTACRIAENAMSAAYLRLVAAVARNGVIGHANRLPWRLPSDLQHFRRLTWGKPMVMGRRTFESIGRVLPGRISFVVTHRRSGWPAGVVAGELEPILTRAAAEAARLGIGEVIIAGGAEIYAQTIGRAERLNITEVDLEVSGDAVFPAIDPAYWREEARSPPQRGQNDSAAFALVEYARRTTDD